MKKVPFLILFVFCLASFLTGFLSLSNVTYAENIGGNAVQTFVDDLDASGKVVKSAEQKFADYVNGYNVTNVNDDIVLSEDLDMKDFVLTNTIGNESLPFAGSFDGKGFRILNLKLDTSVSVSEDQIRTTQNSGLFGVVKGGAKKVRIQNVAFSGNVEITTGGCSSANIGVLAGKAENAIFEYVQITSTVVLKSTTETMEGKTGFDYGFNFGTLAGSAQNCNILNVICRTTNSKGFGALEFSNDGNKVSNFGGIIGRMSSTALSYAIVAAHFKLDFKPEFGGTLNLGGVVGSVTDGGSIIKNIAAENSFAVTGKSLASKLGDVVGFVANPAPETGNLAYIHFKSNSVSGIEKFGDVGSYKLSEDCYISESLERLSYLESDNNGGYKYFSNQTWDWQSKWNFDTVWYVNANTIFLQSFANDFKISFDNLNEKVLKLNSSLDSNFGFGDEVVLEFSFNSIEENGQSINLQEYYTLSAIELKGAEVARIVTTHENGRVNYRISGSDLFSIEATEGGQGFKLTINSMSMATSGNYNIKLDANQFKVSFSTQLFDESGLVENVSPAYVFYGSNNTLESFSFDSIHFDERYQIETKSKPNEAVAFVGWFVIKGEQVIDLKNLNSVLDFNFGRGAFTENCEVVARYSKDACEVIFNIDEGISKIVCSGNEVTNTNQKLPLPKQATALKLEIYVDKNFSFDVDLFIEFMDTYKSSNTTFCTLREDYETEQGHYYHFVMDMRTLQGDYANQFTIEAKTTRKQNTENNLIWWIVGGVAGGIVLIGLIVLIVVLVKRRGGGFGGGKMKGPSVNKKSYKNMYY